MHVLEINTSARQEGSISRRLVNDLLEALEDRYPGIRVTQRNVAAGLPFVDDAWVGAAFACAAVERPPRAIFSRMRADRPERSRR